MRRLVTCSRVCLCAASAAALIRSSAAPIVTVARGHYDRGTCDNSLVVRRPIIESQVVDLITRQMLAPAARARFVRSFNEALKHILRPKAEDQSRLRAAEGEVQNLVAAIAAGAGEIPELAARLRQTKERVEFLQTQASPRPDIANGVHVLPSVMEGYLKDLGRLLEHDLEGAREHLRRLLGTITLKPTDGALLAIVRGNLAGILPVGNLGAGSPVRVAADFRRSVRVAAA